MSGDKIGRRKLLKRTGQASVATAMLATGTITAADGDAAVPKGQAFEIARESVACLGSRSEFSDWSRTGVREPELFYAKVSSGTTAEYQPRSWIFPVENGNEDVGYINVSAVQTDQPVLTYGRGTAPQRLLAEAKRKTPASSNSITGRFIYHGGVEYLVESTEVGAVKLRGGRPTDPGAVETVEQLSPTSGSKQDSQQDWSGSTDSEVSGVPNWTTTDDGNADSTDIGKGDDSWVDWDGCIPVAASMVLGYHEDVSESDVDRREALIDRMHNLMGTGDGSLCDYCTYWSDIPTGIENYDAGSNSYNASNIHSGFRDNALGEIDSGRPIMLNMENGPYTDKGEGHSVAGVGYRKESCGWLCSDVYYKVHDGYNDNPDLVTHGAWDDACITEVSVA